MRAYRLIRIHCELAGAKEYFDIVWHGSHARAVGKIESLLLVWSWYLVLVRPEVKASLVIHLRRVPANFWNRAGFCPSDQYLANVLFVRDECDKVLSFWTALSVTMIKKTSCFVDSPCIFHKIISKCDLSLTRALFLGNKRWHTPIAQGSSIPRGHLWQIWSLLLVAQRRPLQKTLRAMMLKWCLGTRNLRHRAH